VVAIPSLVFYDNADAGRSQVRFAFCKRLEVLTEALSRLTRVGWAGSGQLQAGLGD
jgi:N-succinyldiaminopimelate aminotransferase